MRRLLAITLCLIMAACTPIEFAADISPTATDLPAVPQPIPVSANGTFVDSDITLGWTWRDLADNERFVVHLWYGDGADNYREVWSEAASISAQEQIDSYGRDVGAFHWQVAALKVNASGGFSEMASEWSEVQTLQRVRRMPIDPLPASEWSDMARHLHEQGYASIGELLHYTRNFVHDNTNIGEDNAASAHERFAADYSDAAQMMIDYAEGNIDAGPGLWCDGMTTAMHTVLAELGIESRLIFFYGQVPGYISQHTMIEVFNADTQLWELHDPTFNLYFVDGAGGIASVERVVFGNLDSVTACDASDDCTKDNLAIVQDYFDAFRYGYSNEFWVNPDRFDVSVRVEAFDNRNLPEFLTGNSRDFIFHFDSWE
ncbi:MAG: hypothetical protein KC615_13830 [Anaerolineae bacterium]|nr:hypothetical protein [Anaerolineae bacterium]